MSKPIERRTSKLAGQTPVTAPLIPTHPVPAVVPAETPAPQPHATAPGRRISRTKMTYYVDDSAAGRIRAAFYAARDERGWRNLTDMQLELVMQEVTAIEERYNGGQPFTPMPAGTGPIGRPLE